MTNPCFMEEEKSRVVTQSNVSAPLRLNTPHHTPLCHLDLPRLGWSILNFCASGCPVGITRCRPALPHIIKKKKGSLHPPQMLYNNIYTSCTFPGTKKFGIQIASKISLFFFCFLYSIPFLFFKKTCKEEWSSLLFQHWSLWLFQVF